MPPRRQQQQAPANGANPAPTYNINGPTSALTSFLREQGITGNIHRRPQPPSPAPASPSTPAQESSTASSSPAASTSGNAVASTSTSTTAATKRKASTSAAAAKKKKKDDDGEDDDEFEIAGVPLKAKPARYENRMPGAISVCGECGKKFTVTKYTATNPLGRGLLCSPCTNELSGGALSKPADGAKRAPKKRAKKAVEEREFKPVKTLQQLCIAVIGDNIKLVSDFGDIGPRNRDRVAKIVSKHRALEKENLKLFLDVGHTELSLYDCTNIEPEDLASIATFCPNLERVKLLMCGRMDDTTLEAWSRRMKDIKYIQLYAPYLVTKAGWKKYFESFEDGRMLEGFGIRQSARFDDSAIQALVEHHPNLFNLQLSELGRMGPESLPLLHSLKHLTTLDISRAGVPEGTTLDDESVVALIENVGENLVELILDQNYNLTDRVLIEAVKPHCPHLRHLSLKSLDRIQSSGLESLFQDWVNTGLTHVNLHRCLSVEGPAITSLLNHSSHSLVDLNLHSVDMLEEDVLMDVARRCGSVKQLDISFVRAVDNFVVKEMLDKMTSLERMFVHGDNRAGVQIRGLEGMLHVEL